MGFTYDFGGTNAGGDRPNAFTDDYIYSDYALPGARQAMDGSFPLLGLGFSTKVSGRNGGRTMYGKLGAGGGGGDEVAGPAQFVGAEGGAYTQRYFGVQRFWRNAGGTLRVVVETDGSMWYNRNSGAPGVIHTNPPDDNFGGALVGYFEYALVPARPTNVSVVYSADGKTSRVYWDNPDDGGYGIHRFRIEVSRNLAFTDIWGVGDFSGPGQPINDMTPDTLYHYRVTAANIVSDYAGLPGGNYSSIISRRSPGPSAKPTLAITPNPNGTSVTAEWDAELAATPSAITGWELQRAASSAFTGTVVTTAYAGSARSATPSGLTPGSVSYWRVRSNSAAGYSAWSAVRSTATLNTPNPPTISGVANEDGDQVTITFTDPSNVGGAPITSRALQRATNDTFTTGLTTKTVSAGAVVDVGLTAGTRYYYRASATNSVGASDWSATFAITPESNGLGRINVGTGYVEAMAMIRNPGNTAYMEADGRMRNAANTAWVAIGS